MADDLGPGKVVLELAMPVLPGESADGVASFSYETYCGEFWHSGFGEPFQFRLELSVEAVEGLFVFGIGGRFVEG